MNCPKCGNKMLAMPLGEEKCKILEYWLCMNCNPYYRVIQSCKWQIKNVFAGNKLHSKWCSKGKHACSVESEPCGYVYCPQIREWQEQSAAWAKKFDKAFEEGRMCKICGKQTDEISNDKRCFECWIKEPKGKFPKKYATKPYFPSR